MRHRNLPLPLSPTPRSKPELGQPLLSRERAKLGGRGKTDKWDSPCILLVIFGTMDHKTSHKGKFFEIEI